MILESMLDYTLQPSLKSTCCLQILDILGPSRYSGRGAWTASVAPVVGPSAKRRESDRGEATLQTGQVGTCLETATTLISDSHRRLLAATTTTITLELLLTSPVNCCSRVESSERLTESVAASRGSEPACLLAARPSGTRATAFSLSLDTSEACSARLFSHSPPEYLNLKPQTTRRESEVQGIEGSWREVTRISRAQCQPRLVPMPMASLLRPVLLVMDASLSIPG